MHGHTRLEVIWTVIPRDHPRRDRRASSSTSCRRSRTRPPRRTRSASPSKATSSTGSSTTRTARARSTTCTCRSTRSSLLTVKSYDVVHSWWIPQLGGKIQAIPGRTNHIWFKADRAGTYYGQCAELCGLYHEAMQARVVATSDGGLPRVHQRRRRGRALGTRRVPGRLRDVPRDAGRGRLRPEPRAQPAARRSRRASTAIVRNGRGKMPPVGDSWTNDADVGARSRTRRRTSTRERARVAVRVRSRRTR